MDRGRIPPPGFVQPPGSLETVHVDFHPRDASPRELETCACECVQNFRQPAPSTLQGPRDPCGHLQRFEDLGLKWDMGNEKWEVGSAK